MAQPPARAPSIVRNVQTYSPKDGLHNVPPPTTSQTSKLPILDFATSSPQLMAIDAVAFSFSATAGTQTVTFPNLPRRDNTQNPLQAQVVSQKPLAIEPKDHLIFVAFAQITSCPATVVLQVQPQAVDLNNLRIPGPFLGANVFQTFQALLTPAASGGTVGTVAGMLVGMLVLSVG